MEARFEDERDALTKEINKEQTQLKSKFKDREVITSNMLTSLPVKRSMQ